MDAFATVRDRVAALRREGERLIVAIDGRCGAGKTTLSEALRQEFGCALFHMDDFFLRPEQRTAERLAAPGGNVDRERFAAEILDPLRAGAKRVALRPFDCAAMTMGPAVEVEAGELVVVEGSYSCHPGLWDAYGLRVFLTLSPAEQLARIERRGGKEAAERFRRRWIPLEERYFEAFDLPRRCDLCIPTDAD